MNLDIELNNKYLYKVNKNEKLQTWINDNKSLLNTNVDTIQKFIDELTEWFQTKYSKYYFNAKKGTGKHTIPNIIELSDSLKLKDFDNSLYSALREIMDCPYLSRAIIKSSDRNIMININNDGTIDDKSIIDEATNHLTITSLYYRLRLKNNGLDISDLKRVIDSHNTMLELRKKLFTLVALKLFYESNDNYAYDRIIYYLTDIKDYYGVDIDYETIRNIITPNKKLIKR